MDTNDTTEVPRDPFGLVLLDFCRITSSNERGL